MNRFILCWLLLVTASVASAMNGIQQIGYGVKAKGMGGVAIALPQDAFAIANNPGGLVCVGNRFDSGLHWIRWNAGFTIAPGFDERLKRSSGRNVILPEVAGSWRFCPGQSLGIALFCYGGFDTRYRPPWSFFGTGEPGMEFKQFFVSPCWSFCVGRRHSVGLAVNVVFAWASVKGLEHFLTEPPLVGATRVAPDHSPLAKSPRFGSYLGGLPRGPDPSADPTSESPFYASDRGTDHEEGMSLRLGWLWRPFDCIAVGATYQTRTWLNRFKNYKGFFAARGDLDLPGQLGVGCQATLFQSWTIAADLIWIMWHDIAQFGHSFNPGSTEPFGAPAGPGFGWKDRAVVKVGACVQATRCLQLRAGWNYSKVPFHSDQLLLNTLNAAMVEHHVTVGGTYLLGCTELSLVFIHGFRKDLSAVPSSLSPVSKLHGQQFSVGAAFARRF